MSRLSIVKYPAPVLRKKAAPVERVTPELRAFIDEMSAMMYDAHGVGLAAPQVGISLRIIVVDIGDDLQAVLNPEILAQEGTQTGVEGCLSLPDLHGDVTRAQQITLHGLDLRGKKITLSGEEFWARAMQHEIDHLNGILFTDRVIPDTLRWVTKETDANGDYLERPTTLADALRVFQQLASVG